MNDKRTEYHEERRRIYERKQECFRLSNPASIDYSWVIARHEENALAQAKARFAADWLGTPDIAAREQNRRWGALRARLARHFEQRAYRAERQRASLACSAAAANRDVAGVLAGLRQTWGEAA